MSEGTEQKQPKADLSSRVEELLGAIDAACADLESRMKEEDAAALEEVSSGLTGLVSSDDGLVAIGEGEDIRSSVAALESEVEDQVRSLLSSLEVASPARDRDVTENVPAQGRGPEATPRDETLVSEPDAAVDETLGMEQVAAIDAQELESALGAIAADFAQGEEVTPGAAPTKGPEGSAARAAMADDLDALDAELATLAESMLESLEEEDEAGGVATDEESSSWEKELVATIDEAVAEAAADELSEPEPALPVAEVSVSEAPTVEGEGPASTAPNPVAAHATIERDQPEAILSQAKSDMPTLVRDSEAKAAKSRGRAVAAMGGMAMRAAGRAAVPLMAQALLLSAKPAEKLPDTLRQTAGWLAVYTAFLGVCVWAFVLVFREPNIPVATEEPIGLYNETSGN
ncbi:MAG: hypothetical protein KF757_00895 [Phycisphaeraceae bacterium]|nr:hypothetical protein [Phycisphaeraceae bacterium]MCW5761764.1 hypothetical protein [Phycisphaeraceae bacterium]